MTHIHIAQKWPFVFAFQNGGRTVFNLDAFLRDCLLDTLWLPFVKGLEEYSRAACLCASFVVTFPFAVRDRILGKMDISSDLIRLSYAICTYVNNLSSV